MSRNANDYLDPEDMFADTRMSFGDHLEDLRRHLWRAIKGFLIAMLLSFVIGKPFMKAFIIAPVETQLTAYYEHVREKRKNEALEQVKENPELAANQPRYQEVALSRSQLKAVLEGRTPEPIAEPEKVPPDEWVKMQLCIPDPVKAAAEMLDAQRFLEPLRTIKSFSIMEAFLVYFKISMVCGLVLGSPWIFYQIWSFVAAGLYPHEKRYVHFYLPFSLGLFLAGVLACQFVVMPKAIQALLWFNEWLNIEPDLRLNEWLGFAIMLPVIFGISFQTPLVMLFLERLGIFTVESYRSKRKIAFFLLAVLAAAAPTFEAFSMLFQWIALCLLYQLGIWLCLWSPRQPDIDLDVPEPEEMVEV